MPVILVGLVLLSAFMHAGWNLLVQERRGSEIFLYMTGLVAALGVGPAIALEFLGEPIPARAWAYLLAGAAFQGAYFLGLSRGYRSGDFTVVYPVARALPVLLVGVGDLVVGRSPSALGWLGLALVTAGCILVPLVSLRTIKWSSYYNQSTAWILLTALATVGYSLTDKEGTSLLEPGLLSALRYDVFEIGFAFLAYGLILKAFRQPVARERSLLGWLTAGLAGLLLFGAYALVLWAFQLSPNASYVVALRQFSIVLGVAAGSLLFREEAPLLRISASAVLVVGIIFIVIGG